MRRAVDDKAKRITNQMILDFCKSQHDLIDVQTMEISTENEISQWNRNLHR